MIIRKPYAFLIKNFRKVHGVLLIISLYILYKLFSVSSFVNEFMVLGTYDSYNNPITKKINFFLYLAIIVSLVGSIALLFLLKRKEKPCRVYLVPVIEFIFLILVLSMINGFFNGYTNDIATTDVRLSRDLLLMFIVAHFASIAIFTIRAIGIDINKFNFTSDQEFLELSEEDREEVELRVKFDKNIFIRLFNKTFRNLKYFYLEHKFICNIVLGVVGGIFLLSMGRYIFITNRSYSEGDSYKANGYTIRINKSYFTDKDGAGNIITKNSNFVIVDLTVTNHDKKRNLDLENFHLKNGTSDYTTTRKTYDKEFSDIGTTYDTVKELKRDETNNFIIVYKVDKNLNKNKFVLFYQEKGGRLRKIKLKIEDVSKIEDKGNLNLEEEFTFVNRGKKETVSLDSYSFSKTVNYMIRHCSVSDCYTERENYTADNGYTVMKIDFASDNFEGKEMVDFSTDYGTIIYIDNSKVEQSVKFKYPIKKKALGKYIYTLVPEDVSKSSKLAIIYVVRNKKYTYILK